MKNGIVNAPAISIIIPVYNTQDYIERCIRSILCQSFTDLEVIAVDDGSTDASWDVLTRLAASDSRLHIYHKENGGVSAARNMAMEYAHGAWYMFVDSDDELLPNALKSMWSAVKSTPCDMVVGNYKRIKETGEVIHSDKYQSAEEWSLDRIVDSFFHFKPDRFQGYLWNRLFRAEIIKKYNLQFNKGILYKEDGLFLMQYLLRSRSNVMTIPEEVYTYYDRVDSAMGKIRKGFEPAHITNLYARVLILDEIKQYTPTSENIMMAKQSINNMARILVRQMIRARYFYPQTWWRIFITTARAGALFTNSHK